MPVFVVATVADCGKVEVDESDPIRDLPIVSTYTIEKTQAELPALLDEVGVSQGACGISVGGELRAYLISRERMERIVETLEMLGNRDAVGSIRAYEAGGSQPVSLDAFDWQA